MICLLTISNFPPEQERLEGVKSIHSVDLAGHNFLVLVDIVDGLLGYMKSRPVSPIIIYVEII